MVWWRMEREDFCCFFACCRDSIQGCMIVVVAVVFVVSFAEGVLVFVVVVPV